MHISEQEARAAALLLEQAADRTETVLRGKRPAIRDALAAILGGGHLLIEDLPGAGKTTLAKALSIVLGLKFSRIQFTSDLLPSDVTGAQVFDPRTAEFSFRPGPVFSGVVLADEINRAPPRTQSALLEAMSEGQVTIDGTPHPLPSPFVVLATQNPLDQSGTYPLPDSQLDRFLLRISLGYPSAAAERELLLSRDAVTSPLDALSPLLGPEKLQELRRAAQSVRMDPSLAGYIARLVQATRETKLLAAGVSTRGLLALGAASRAAALLDGRNFLLPDDVKHMAVPVLAHRVRLARGSGELLDARDESGRVIQALVDMTEVPT